MSCDSTGLPNSKLTPTLRELESTRTSITKSDLEKWAELVALNAAQIQNATPIFLGATDTPEAWRTDVEALTPNTGQSEANLLAKEIASFSVGGPSASSNESELSRIQVRLNAGDLGELSLVIERSVAGLSVRIGAEDSGVLAAIARNGDSLTQALTSIGQTVTSLTFVAMDGVGINLAPSRMIPSNKTGFKEADGNHDETNKQQARRKTRRLDVRG
jgi:hypothetical protein